MSAPELATRLRRIARGYDPTDYGVAVNLDDAADAINRLTEEVARLSAFARAIVRLAWKAEVDGAAVQEAAEEHGLIVAAPYDPVKHGNIEWCDQGDRIYVFADWIADRAALPMETT